MSRLLGLVDRREWRRLFIEELGWNSPDRADFTASVDNGTYRLRQVASYRGLGIWVCDSVPPPRVQRLIDRQVGLDNQERLVIFAGNAEQEWRWPRRAQTGGVNAKLLMHPHSVGAADPQLEERLRAIEIDLDARPSVVELLARMREAFDTETVTASVQAAKLMQSLYEELDRCGLSDDDATLLLARLLFLLFGDDGAMWQTDLSASLGVPRDLFQRFLHEHTTPETLHVDLEALFSCVDIDPANRPVQDGSPLRHFPYINGGLFAERLALPPLSATFRDGLLAAGEFDWQVISPAVFGSMFQTVKDREARRHTGEHYTTEENILRTIEPLFLDQLRQRLETAWNDKGALTKLHNDLARIRVLDPACGCGNFLVVAYRELRAIELEVLKRRRDLDELDSTSSGRDRSQFTLDVTHEIKVTLDHFYGFEINEWPARIAETAMLLVDHLANQRMAAEFGTAPYRLPIRIAPTIKHSNALTIDWESVLTPSADVIVVGNPPFIGHATRTPAQAHELRAVWGTDDISRLDYVTGWYKKALDYFGAIPGRWAFVSTNSITQGDPVPLLFERILDAGWRIAFAHRTFPWSSEAPGSAAVHCVIIGFTREPAVQPILFDHSKPNTVQVRAKNINAYLVDGPNVLIRKRMEPLSPGLPPATFGNMPRDGGNLIVEPSDYETVNSDPIAARFLRRYIGSEELLHDKPRWCLWLTDATEDELQASQELIRRVEAVREFRAKSTAASTRQMALTPHLFGQRPALHTAPYVVIPRVSSENRRYFPVMHVGPEVIASDATFTAPDPTGYLFALISSAMFMAWQRLVGGRLKSDLRFSNTIVWNNFPVPAAEGRQREAIIECGAEIRRARSELRGMSLAAMYSATGMPAPLVAVHQELDRAVDRLFGATRALTSEYQRQRLTLTQYSRLAGDLEPSELELA